MLETLFNRLDEIYPELVSFRRDLHMPVIHKYNRLDPDSACQNQGLIFLI